MRQNIGALCQHGKSLATGLVDFVKAHPTLAKVQCVLPAPKSDPGTPDLPSQWAHTIASTLGREFVTAAKTRQTNPQKERADDESEDDAVARVADSMVVNVSLDGRAVLILDDTIGSGGTMIELARAARAAGAYAVFGLGVAKDATFARGGVNLSQEQWP